MYTKYDTLTNTGLWKSLIFELIIVLITPYPFFNGIKYKENVKAFDTKIEYEMNDILLGFSFCRIYLGLRFVLYLSNFMNPRS